MMNPKAENVWQYLQICLSCAAWTNLLDASDMREDEFQGCDTDAFTKFVYCLMTQCTNSS
jgi:hypothetical protein